MEDPEVLVATGDGTGAVTRADDGEGEAVAFIGLVWHKLGWHIRILTHS